MTQKGSNFAAEIWIYRPREHNRCFYNIWSGCCNNYSLVLLLDIGILKKKPSYCRVNPDSQSKDSILLEESTALRLTVRKFKSSSIRRNYSSLFDASSNIFYGDRSSISKVTVIFLASGFDCSDQKSWQWIWQNVAVTVANWKTCPMNGWYFNIAKTMYFTDNRI